MTWPVAVVIVAVLVTFVFVCKYATQNGESVREHERRMQDRANRHG